MGKQRVDLDCSSKDCYKRLICTITYNSMDINREMVRQVGAWVFRKYYKGTDYYAAENEAKAAHAGLWKTTEYQAIAPWEWRRGKRK